MNHATIHQLLDRSLAGTVTFPEILAALEKEEIESYHVDFITRQYRYYAGNGETYTTDAPLRHEGVAAEFSAGKLAALNQRVQAGQAFYADFVREGAAAGCAYYIVYLRGRKVRYFGRDGGEHVQFLPGSTK